MLKLLSSILLQFAEILLNGTPYPIKREIHTANIIYKTLWDWFTEYIIWNHNWIVQMEVQSAIQSYSLLTSYRSWMSRIAEWFVNADEEETDANVTKCNDTVDFTQGIIVWGTTICDSIIWYINNLQSDVENCIIAVAKHSATPSGNKQIEDATHNQSPIPIIEAALAADRQFTKRKMCRGKQ